MEKFEHSFYYIRLVFLILVAVGIIIYPRSYDTGFLHLPDQFFYLVFSIFFGLLSFIYLLKVSTTRKLSKCRVNIFGFYTLFSIIFASLLFISNTLKIPFRTTKIIDFGYDRDENYSHDVPVYLFEDFAYIGLGIMYIFFWLLLFRKKDEECIKFTFKIFPLFFAVFILIAFYFGIDKSPRTNSELLPIDSNYNPGKYK